MLKIPTKTYLANRKVQQETAASLIITHIALCGVPLCYAALCTPIYALGHIVSNLKQPANGKVGMAKEPTMSLQGGPPP